MNRRKFLRLGVGVGATLGVGLYARARLLPPSPSRTLEPVDLLAQRLYVGLNDAQREASCVEYEHPLRQYHNRGVWGGGLGVFSSFDRQQRQILTDLLYAGLSSAGRKRIPEEYYTRFFGVHSLRVLICGDPTAPPYQIIFTGAHLNLRLGGKSIEGVAFGGPQVYGDQRGNNRVGLPGNLYRQQFVLAEQLFQSLDSGRRSVATLPEAPIQTQIDVQGKSGSFPGLPIRELSVAERTLARRLIEEILSTWPAEDSAYAQECLAANGGVEALSLSTYEHGSDGPIPAGQVFRLEGPGAVLYFRGYPHVHAFVNVAMDGDRPLSVGEVVGENPHVLEGDLVKDLFERALRSELKADLAHYPRESVAGRLRAGTIRSGDIFALENWQEASKLVRIPGAGLSPTLRSKLQAQGILFDPKRIYTVATTEHALGDHSLFGRIDSHTEGSLVRDLTVSHIRAHGFPARQG